MNNTAHKVGHIVNKALKHGQHVSRAKLSRSARLTLIARQYSTTTNQGDKGEKNNKQYSYKDYCLDEVRKKDYEHFFNALLYPKNVREANIALRAFNIEIATIKDIVSKPEIGLMRINFWKDTIKNLYKGEIPELPVAKALGDAIGNFKLTRGWFTRLLDARERDIMTQQPHTLADIEEYAEQTASSMYYLSLETMGVKDVHADHVASHIGKAYGLTTLLRGVPFHASRKQIYLPMDLTTKYGVSTEQYFRGDIDNKLIEVFYEIANVAKAHLDHSRELKKDVPKQAFPAFLPSVWIDDYLDRLQEANFNPFDQKVVQIHRHPRLGAKLKVAKNYYLNKY